MNHGWSYLLFNVSASPTIIFHKPVLREEYLKCVISGLAIDIIVMRNHISVRMRLSLVFFK